MNQYFKELVTQRALTFKVGSVSLEAISGIDQISEKAEVKNVCVPLPIELATELENALNFLQLSKREFLTQAIRSALEDVALIVKDWDIFEYHDEWQAEVNKRQEEKKAVSAQEEKAVTE
jgi:hypothetical protein